MDITAAINQSRQDDKNRSWSELCWVSDSRRCIYMAVPKVASTTVKAVMRRLEGGELPEFIGRVHGQGARLSGYSTVEVMQMLISPDWLKFSFVRNPYGRLFSAYKSKICVLGSLDTNPVWEKEYSWLRDDIREAFDYPVRDGKRVGTVAFRDYVRYISTCDDPKVVYDIHINSQANILSFDCITYDFIGRFENFQTDFLAVLERLGAPPHLGDAVAEVNNESPHMPLAAAYDRELAATVYDMYQADFAMFGYDRDSWMFSDQ